MEFKVNGNLHTLKFGIGFLFKLDEVYKAEHEGMKLGAGIQLAYPSLLMMSVPALARIIHCALPNGVSLGQVNEAIEEYADDHDGLEGLFDAVVEGLAKSNVIKDTINKLMPTNKEETPEI
ncbi:TPA: tail assembly chaperone [Streptococcus suis]